MATIPNPTTIPLRQPVGTAPIASIRTNAGSGLSAVGAAVSRVAQERQERQTRYQASTAASKFLIGKTKLDSSFDQDDDFSTIRERYETQANELMNESAIGITDPAERNLFIESQGVRIASGIERIDDLAFGKERDFNRSEVEQQLADLRETVITTENGVDAMLAAEGLIAAAADNDYLSHEEAGTMYRTWKSDAAVGWLKSIAPEKRLEALNSPLADNLPSDVKAIMLREAEEANLAQRAADTVLDYMSQDLTRADMNVKSDEITDEKMRTEVKTRFDYAINAQEKAELESRTETFEELFFPVRSGEPGAFEKITSEQWENLSPDQQNSLFVAHGQSVSTTVVKSDPDVIIRLHELNTVGAFGELREYFDKHRGDLSSEDVDTWAQVSIEGVVPDKYKTLIVNSQLLQSKLNASGLSGTNLKSAQGPMLEKLRDWHMRYWEDKGSSPDDNLVEGKIDQLLQESRYHSSWYSTTRLYELDDEGVKSTLKKMEAHNSELFNKLKPKYMTKDPLDFIEAFEYATRP